MMLTRKFYILYFITSIFSKHLLANDNSLSKKFFIYKNIESNCNFLPPLYKFEEIIELPVPTEPFFTYYFDDINVDPGFTALDIGYEDFDVSKLYKFKKSYLKFGHTSSPSPIFEGAYIFNLQKYHRIGIRAKHKSRGKEWKYFDNLKNKLELIYIGEIKDFFLKGRVFGDYKKHILHIEPSDKDFFSSNIGAEFYLKDIFSESIIKSAYAKVNIHNFDEKSNEKSLLSSTFFQKNLTTNYKGTIISKFSLGTYDHYNIKKARNNIDFKILNEYTFSENHIFEIGAGLYGDNDKNINGKDYGNFQILPELKYKYILNKEKTFYIKPLYSYSEFKNARNYIKRSPYINSEFAPANEYGFGSCIGAKQKLANSLESDSRLGYLHRKNISIYNIAADKNFFSTKLVHTHGAMVESKISYNWQRVSTLIFMNGHSDIFPFDKFGWISSSKIELGTRTTFSEKYNLECKFTYFDGEFYYKTINDETEYGRLPISVNMNLKLDVKLNENWFVFASLDNIFFQNKVVAPHIEEAPIMISFGAWYVV